MKNIILTILLALAMGMSAYAHSSIVFEDVVRPEFCDYSGLIKSVRLNPINDIGICSGEMQRLLKNINSDVNQDSIFSISLNKHMRYTIHKPTTYKYTETKTFPLVVLFDRQNESINEQLVRTIRYLENNDQAPHSIILEIETDFPDRWEYSDHPIVRENGKMVLFSAFLHKELIPAIEKDLRSNSNRTLIGHSAMGHFTNYVLATNPEYWNCIISISSFYKVRKLNLIDSLSKSIEIISAPVSYFTAQGQPHQDTDQDLLFDSLYNQVKSNPFLFYKRFSYPFANHTTVPGIAIGEILTHYWGEYNVKKIELGQKNYNSKGNLHPDTLMNLYSGLSKKYKDTLYYELGNIVGSANTYSSNKKYDFAVYLLEKGLVLYPKYYHLYVMIANNKFKVYPDGNQYNAYIMKAIEVVNKNKTMWDDSETTIKYLKGMLK